MSLREADLQVNAVTMTIRLFFWSYHSLPFRHRTFAENTKKEKKKGQNVKGVKGEAEEGGRALSLGARGAGSSETTVPFRWRSCWLVVPCTASERCSGIRTGVTRVSVIMDRLAHQSNQSIPRWYPVLARLKAKDVLNTLCCVTILAA